MTWSRCTTCCGAGRDARCGAAPARPTGRRGGRAAAARRVDELGTGARVGGGVARRVEVTPGEEHTGDHQQHRGEGHGPHDRRLEPPPGALGPRGRCRWRGMEAPPVHAVGSGLMLTDLRGDAASDADGPTGSVGRVSTTPTRVFAARLVGLPIFDPQGDQVGKVRDLVVALRSRGQPAAGARAGGRGVRPAPDLRADDPGHQHRQRAGLHHRAAQHAPLRAALHRDPGDRPDARPHGHASRSTGVDRHRLRRRDGAGPHPRLGALAGSRSRSRPRASAAAARPTSWSGATSRA